MALEKKAFARRPVLDSIIKLSQIDPAVLDWLIATDCSIFKGILSKNI